MSDDPQQHKLYAWERAFVETRVREEVLSRDETLDLVARSSGLLAIEPPRVRFIKLNVSCRANMRLHVMEVADWGRTRWTILHEMAHFATWRDVLGGDSPHGRAFLSVSIALYHRFLGIPLDHMIGTARSQGLDLDERRARGLLPSEARSSFYPGDL